MQVVAASVLDTVGRFLHSGYVSAFPPSQIIERDILTPDRYPAGAVPELRLDVAEALRLQGEQLAAVVSGGDTTPAVLAAASGTPWQALLAGALCASGLIIGHRLLSRHDPSAAPSRARLWRGALASSIATTLALAVACGDHGDGGRQESSTPSHPSAEASTGEVATPTEVTPVEAEPDPVEAEPDPVEAEPDPVEAEPDPVEARYYQNPEAATQVILHGLIGNALRHRSSVSTLADLARDIVLPVSTLTEGEAYALKTYAFDGWGRELQLLQGNDTFTVTSSGEDGVLATDDDLVLSVPVARLSSSDAAMVAPAAWYVVEPQDTPYLLFFHPPVPATSRPSGSLIEYVNHVPNAELAAEVTGGNSFGLFTMEQLPAAAPDLLIRYDEMAATVGHKPLMLEVFDAQT